MPHDNDNKSDQDMKKATAFHSKLLADEEAHFARLLSFLNKISRKVVKRSHPNLPT